MKKKIILFTLIFLIAIPDLIGLGDGILDFVIGEQLDILNIGELNKVIEELSVDNEIIRDFSLKEVLKKMIKGEDVIQGGRIKDLIVDVLFKELRENLSLVSKILAITLISAILTNLTNTFENSSIGEIGNYIAYMLIAILVIGSFSQIMTTARITINRMVNFMQIFLPILLTLLVATSGPNTRLLFHPMILATVNMVGVLVKDVILPLIYFSFVISLLSNLSKKVELNKLSDLGRQTITIIISAAFTIFIGIISIYGLSTKIDGLTIRTAKFAIDKFIPIVGGFLSDAMETVIGSSAILKNGIGVIGLLILLIYALAPIVKMLILIFLFRVISAVIQPVSPSNLVEFFSQASKSLMLLLVSVLSVTTMFYITITIIVETGNNILMLR